MEENSHLSCLMSPLFSNDIILRDISPQIALTLHSIFSQCLLVSYVGANSMEAVCHLFCYVNCLEFVINNGNKMLPHNLISCP